MADETTEEFEKRVMVEPDDLEVPPVEDGIINEVVLIGLIHFWLCDANGGTPVDRKFARAVVKGLKDTGDLPWMKANDLLDPDMPADQLRLHMGEMTPQEIRTARAAIRWANTKVTG